MKTIVDFDKEIGSDGAKVKGALGVEAQDLRLEVAVTYPIAKVVEPATQALDKLLDKIKATIPGTWDDVAIDKFKVEYKEDLVALLSEG